MSRIKHKEQFASCWFSQLAGGLEAYSYNWFESCLLISQIDGSREVYHFYSNWSCSKVTQSGSLENLFMRSWLFMDAYFSTVCVCVCVADWELPTSRTLH